MGRFMFSGVGRRVVTLASMWRGRLLSVRVRLAVRADTPGLGTHNLLVAG